MGIQSLSTGNLTKSSNKNFEAALAMGRLFVLPTLQDWICRVLICAEGQHNWYSLAVEFDPETSIAPDGSIGPTQRQHELAVESLKLQEHLKTLEAEQASASKAKDREGVQRIAEVVRSGYHKLSEIQRQQREEQGRKNRALGYE